MGSQPVSLVAGATARFGSRGGESLFEVQGKNPGVYEPGNDKLDVEEVFSSRGETSPHMAPELASMIKS